MATPKRTLQARGLKKPPAFKKASAGIPASPRAKKAPANPSAKTPARVPANKAKKLTSPKKTKRNTPASTPPAGAAHPIRARTSPATRAMFDLLADSHVHPKEEVLAAGIAAALGEDYYRCAEEGRRGRRGRPATLREYAHSGARNFARNNLMIAERNRRVLTTGAEGHQKCRMPAALAREWQAMRQEEHTRQQREPVSIQPFGDVTSYAGMPEWEGWAYAPLKTQDVAHVRPTIDVPLARLQEAFPGWDVNEGPDGLVSISAHPGAPVKEIVTEWFTDENLHHDGVRDAKNVRRRDLRELPPAFLEDLVAKSVPFARGLVASRHAASMQRLVGDHDDTEAYVMMWVIELAASFDATLGRPFGTWLTNQIPRKVQDLNRASHGRTASDAEMRHARARADFEAEHGRTPSPSELRKVLGLSEEEMHAKRRHLATLAGLRSAGPLETGPDEPDVPVVDDAANPEKDALGWERSQQITLAMLAASGTYDPARGRPVMTRPLGFLVTYLMTWDEWVKGDLIALAGCADRKVTDEVEAVQADLARMLTDLQGD